MGLQYRVASPTAVIPPDRIDDYTEFGHVIRQGHSKISEKNWKLTQLEIRRYGSFVAVSGHIKIRRGPEPDRPVKDIRNDLLIALCGLETTR
jgi:hypothetical protein